MTNPNSITAVSVPTTSDDAGRECPRYLTIEQLSAATTLSVSTLRRLLKKRVIVGHQPGGPRHRIVFPPDAIEQVAKVDQTSGNDPVTGVSPVTSNTNPRRGPQPKWRQRS